MAIEKDPSRWVEVPHDCEHIEITKMMNDTTKWPYPISKIEIGVEFYDQDNGVWPSHACSPADGQSDFQWRQSLKVGDIVDAKDQQKQSGFQWRRSLKVQQKWYDIVVSVPCTVNCARIESNTVVSLFVSLGMKHSFGTSRRVRVMIDN